MEIIVICIAALSPSLCCELTVWGGIIFVLLIIMPCILQLLCKVLFPAASEGENGIWDSTGPWLNFCSYYPDSD